MKLRANIIEKRGTLQVVVSYKDSNGKIRQKWKDTKLKKKGNVNFKFKLATHGDPVARYHQPSNFSNRVGP
ncbi:TPA: hypothetical protein OOG89_001754 [Enterococcus faecium]|nr:hypothetical protein [Enterococcus faecium]